MLDLPRYLLGVADILALAAFAWLGVSQLRSRLLPELSGPPAHLASAVLALALLTWTAELLGSFALFQPVPYLLAVAAIGASTAAVASRTSRNNSPPSGGAGEGGPAGPMEGPGGGGTSCTFSAIRPRSADHAPPKKLSGAPTRSLPPTGPADRGARPSWATLIALLIAAAAVIHFAAGVRLRLSTGMTGFDSTWYHGSFAAGFFQGGGTWDLHYIAPQFLAWFYPANAEIFHAVGMLAFHRDLLSPLLNLGWFAGCLLALWCIGRPFGAAPWSLALGAIALSVPALADQAGEARNDLAGIFFLLAGAAVVLNARAIRSATEDHRIPDGRGGGAGARGERTEDDPAGGEYAENAHTGGEYAEDDDTMESSPGGLSVSRSGGGHSAGRSGGGLPTGALMIGGLAAGLAGGTKLNVLLPAAVFIVGLALIAPPGARWRAFAATGFAALAGGGYWYLRNLVHAGNPLPWFDHLGPVSVPAPEQALGGREGHSVLGYLTDGSVWSHWFLPGLHGGLTVLWPLLVGLALAGLLLSLVPRRPAAASRCVAPSPPASPCSAATPSPPATPSRPSAPNPRSAGTPAAMSGADRLLQVIGLVGLAAALTWLIAPTSASGPEDMPRGFESGLRYLAPALILGLALLPTVPLLREKLAALSARTHFFPHSGNKFVRTSARTALGCTRGLVVTLVILLAATAIGYPVQRHYLRNRYANPEFTTKGLDAAFKWARSISGARIATTGTRQYPLFGTDLSNRVQFVGIPRSHGGFVAPTTCPTWRRALNAGHYDYVVATLDRLEPDKPAYPPQAAWTAGPGTHVVLRYPGTVVFKLRPPLDPSGCP